jgi:YVTN family beta-propeller protein
MPHFAIVVGDLLLVTNFGSGDVTVIRRSSRKEIATIAVGAGPLGAGATRDGKRMLVACHNSNYVAVVDVDKLSVSARIPTDPGPVQVTVAPNQKFAYVANDGRGSVQKIELAAARMTKTISIAFDAGSHGLAFGSGGGVLYVTNTGAGNISAIDTERDIVIATIKVATAPEGIAFKRP